MGWKADLQKQLRQQGRSEEAAALGKDPNARLNYGVVPEQREYTVQRGESWFSIARSELGSGAKETQVAAYAQALANANGLDVLRGGAKIRLPGSIVNPNARPTTGFMEAATNLSALVGYKPAVEALSGTASPVPPGAGGGTTQTPPSGGTQRGGGTIAPTPTRGGYAAPTPPSPFSYIPPAASPSTPSVYMQGAPSAADQQVAPQKRIGLFGTATATAGELPSSGWDFAANLARNINTAITGLISGRPISGEQFNTAQLQRTMQPSTRTAQPQPAAALPSSTQETQRWQDYAAAWANQPFVVQQSLARSAENPSFPLMAYIGASAAEQVGLANSPLVTSGVYERQVDGSYTLNRFAAALAAAINEPAGGGGTSGNWDVVRQYNANREKPIGVRSFSMNQLRPQRGGVGASGSSYYSGNEGYSSYSNESKYNSYSWRWGF